MTVGAAARERSTAFVIFVDEMQYIEEDQLAALITALHRCVQLGREVNSLGPTRSSLITKGMVYSPGHGDTAFTVPLFDQFMKRMIPVGTR